LLPSSVTELFSAVSHEIQLVFETEFVFAISPTFGIVGIPDNFRMSFALECSPAFIEPKIIPVFRTEQKTSKFRASTGAKRPAVVMS
jgi:hypothetical protein